MKALFYTLIGGEIMVTVYVSLIIKGYKTFSQVPVNLKPAVKVELETFGLGTNGTPLETTPVV